MSVYKANKRKLLDLNWNVVIQQESKISPKLDIIWVALLSHPCAVHHAIKSIIYELVVN